VSPALSVQLTRAEARAIHDHFTTPKDVKEEPAARTLRASLARLLADWHQQRREERALRVSAAQARVILRAGLQLAQTARRSRMTGEECAAILTASRKAETALELAAEKERRAAAKRAGD